jgi:hypothetical protein
MLMMNGTLDPATPFAGAKRVADAFHGQNQVFITLPNGTHDPTTPTTDDAGNCMTSLLGQFVTRHGVVTDRSCTQRMKPIDFDGAPALARQAFGTDNAWD